LRVLLLCDSGQLQESSAFKIISYAAALSGHDEQPSGRQHACLHDRNDGRRGW